MMNLERERAEMLKRWAALTTDPRMMNIYERTVASELTGQQYAAQHGLGANRCEAIGDGRMSLTVQLD
jgi:hypothetical protein